MFLLVFRSDFVKLQTYNITNLQLYCLLHQAVIMHSLIFNYIFLKNQGYLVIVVSYFEICLFCHILVFICDIFFELYFVCNSLPKLYL
jgi:hypothetical protein